MQNEEIPNILIFLSPHTIGAGIMVSRLSMTVHPSVSPSIFCFWTITSVNINGFSPNFICALILWSCLGLLWTNFNF